GLIRPDPAVCATAGAACGRKSLSSARIQAIFTSNDTPLGECRRESGLPVEKQIDCIYVLGCGTIANILADHSVSLLPAQGSFLIIPDSPDVVIFLSLFSVYFSQVDMGANFNFLQYIGGDLPRSRVLISKEQIPAAYPGAPIIDEGDR
ncbi:MAG: hypothetical protein KBG46_09030, partial [Paracoccus sp.]|nr:hypothetical protein [Paracoccus sp. (in: a-proteobacteria)]